MTVGATRGDEAMVGVTETLGPYRLLHPLGEGGMGVVHLALDGKGRAVAVKVLRPHIAHDHDARTRLAREVSTLARVRDPRVASVLDADVEGDRPYIVTRYVDGPPLDQVVAEDGPLRGEGLLRLGRGLSEALAAIHAAGVIHRDLKPANVLLLEGDPVVIDFGIAHVADDVRLTMTGLVMGTPGYLSPEVVQGAPVTEATDWWGWAATLAFAASGTPPFGRGPMDVVLDRVRRGQADLSGVDPRLAPLLYAALSPDADERPHADEVVDALDRYAGGGAATVSVALADPTARLTARATRVMPQEPGPGLGQQPAPRLGHEPHRGRSGQAGVPQGAPGEDLPLAAAPEQPAYAQWPQQPERLVLPGEWGGDPGPGAVRPAPGGEWAGEQEGAEESDWQRARESGPGQPDPRIGRAARTGTLSALLVAVLGVAAVWPVVAFAAVLLWCWASRFADRSVTSLVMRRHERGHRRSDVPVAVAASPWHVLSSAVATVMGALLPLVVAVAATFSAALVVATVNGGTPTPEASVPVVVGGLVGVLLAWWGPGGASLRRGSRSLVRGAVRGRTWTEVLVAALCVAAAALAVWASVRHQQLDWWPAQGAPQPFGRLLHR